MSTVAFFDFDGTISRGDSLLSFMPFLLGKRVFYLGVLQNLHWLCGYQLGWVSNARAKEKLIHVFLQGMKEGAFLQKFEEFLPLLEDMIRPSALRQIQWHRDNGDQIVIVSATFEAYLKPWCQKEGLDCIGTKLEVCDGYLSGRFASKNCYGEAKVKRIQERYSLKEYDAIYAYGDSIGDREMLSIAHYPFYRIFD